MPTGPGTRSPPAASTPPTTWWASCARRRRGAHPRPGRVGSRARGLQGTPSGAVDANDTSAVNLGVQFQASSSGNITGIRFYKESDNTGTHSGSLWSSTGTLLASGTFTGESGSGWQELDFSTPVAVTAGTTLVASYHHNTGHYAGSTSRRASTCA